MAEIMGIVNVTPDSFSDGGKYQAVDAALEHIEALLAAGATIIDIGGESTRPGSTRVSPEQEQQRVLPVVREAAALGAVLSVDTLHASTAAQVLAAGAHMINDVSGGLHDSAMYRVVAAAEAKYVLGHWRGIPDALHRRSQYNDVTAEVSSDLFRLTQAALAAGIKAENLILDPGLGFDKTASQCWQLLRELEQLTALNYPVLIGLSRKRMIAETLRPLQQQPDLDLGSAVANAFAVQQGAWGVRTHDVAATAQALAVLGQLRGVDPPCAVTAARPVPVPQKGSDTITLRGLEVFAHHGVLPHETKDGQTFIIDAELTLGFAAATAADDIARTVDYGSVAAALYAAAAADPVQLLETLAERLAAVCLSFSGVTAVRLTVHKPQAPLQVPFADVMFTVTRVRDAGAAVPGQVAAGLREVVQ